MKLFRFLVGNALCILPLTEPHQVDFRAIAQREIIQGSNVPRVNDSTKDTNAANAAKGSKGAKGAKCVCFQRMFC